MDRDNPRRHPPGTGTLVWTVSIILVAGFVVSCMSDGRNSVDQYQGRPLQVEHLNISGLRGGNVPVGHYVLNSSDEWSKFWSKYHEAEAPQLDLEQRTLVAVFLGQKPNPGYSVRITAATDYQNEVVVDVVEYLPSPGMMYAQVIAYPCDVALIPKTNKNIRFNVSRKVG